MAEKKETEVPNTLVESFRETNQAIAQSIVTAQERNMKFAQSTLTSAMEVFKSHMESTRALMKDLEEQAKKQQETVQKMLRGSEQTFQDFFRPPSYQQFLDAAETATRQGLENFQKAIESFEKAAEQGLETFRKATSQAQQTSQKPKE